MSSGTTSIVYERAQCKYRVTNITTSPDQTVNMRSSLVTEGKLRAIGDMDINEALERAQYNPYTEFFVQPKPRGLRQRFSARFV